MPLKCTNLTPARVRKRNDSLSTFDSTCLFIVSNFFEIEKQTYSSASKQVTECKEDWLAVARTNGTNVEKFCAEKCSDYAVRNQQKVDVLILNGELCENCQKPECEAKRKIIQCKCRQSLYVKIWVRPPT